MSDSTYSSDEVFNKPHVFETELDWGLKKFKASGITEAIAQKCSLSLVSGEDGAYIRIPYHTVDGVQMTYFRQRNRVEQFDKDKDHDQSSNWRGKYTQPKHSKNICYWPPIVNQRLLINDVSKPLIVCEGEFKAIACQSAVLGSGLEAAVVGVPGTKLSKDVYDGLSSVVCKTGDKSRDVFICMDWNGKSGDAEATEFALKRMFYGLGARVYLLRWATDSKAEQKLDDWLVAGGDLSEAIRYTKERQDGIDKAKLLIWEYCNTKYAICHGVIHSVEVPTKTYTVTAFGIQEGAVVLPISAKRSMRCLDVWNEQPLKDRNVVSGLQFFPGRIGWDVSKYVYDESGKRMLNTAPPWPEFNVDPTAEYDATPFTDLVLRLCDGNQDHANWFLDWLAQSAQFPAKKTQHIVQIFDSGGTGKDRLADTLYSVFGPYAGDAKPAMEGDFNATTEHLLLAIWSDPHPHGANDKSLAARIKNFTGTMETVINHKYGAKYRARHYSRLLIFSNDDFVVPIIEGARRDVVFGTDRKMTSDEATEYMAWMAAPQSKSAIARFLGTRDLSQFDPYAPGPMTERRKVAEIKSELNMSAFFKSPELLCKDIWTATELVLRCQDLGYGRPSPQAIGAEVFKRTGLEPRGPITVARASKRLLAIRNAAHWKLATDKEWGAEWQKQPAGL